MQVAEQKVPGCFGRHAPAHHLVERLTHGEHERQRRRFRQRRLEQGHLLDGDAVDVHDGREHAAHQRFAARIVLLRALHQRGDHVLVGNAAEVHPELVRRGIVPDLVTDQTSAHDPLNGYVPAGMSLAAALRLRENYPDVYVRQAMQSMAIHVRAMLAFKKRGSIVFDYGNNIRAQAFEAGVQDAFDFRGFVPLFIRPLFCQGKGPFRWAALSGDPKDIYKTDEAVLREFPKNESLHRWIRLAREKVKFQGLPARICWLGYGERARIGKVFNDLVASGDLKAPIVIGRDHLDAGSVASPYRETEGMIDKSDPIADWPILNALLNTAAGATWVSVHHGGGVGIGYSIHAGMVVVCDGTKEAEKKILRVLTTDPGTGVMRHVDAGYDTAVETAKKMGIKIPMMK